MFAFCENDFLTFRRTWAHCVVACVLQRKVACVSGGGTGTKCQDDNPPLGANCAKKFLTHPFSAIFDVTRPKHS